jgi:hypothetical protein
LWWSRLSLPLRWILNIGSSRRSFQVNGEIFEECYFSYSVQFFTIILPYHVIVFWCITLCVVFGWLPAFWRNLLHWSLEYPATWLGSTIIIVFFPWRFEQIWFSFRLITL